MEKHLSLAKATLLEPTGLSEQSLNTVMGSLLGQAITHADIYMQSVRHESWVLEEGIVKEGDYGESKGVGVRALSQEKTGFAYCDDIILPALTDAANVAKKIANRGQSASTQVHAHTLVPRDLYSPTDPLHSLTAKQKIDLLTQADRIARAEHPSVKHVVVSLSGSYSTMLVVNSEGHLAADVRPLVRMDVQVVAQKGDRTEMASFGGGARAGYEYFLCEDRVAHYAKEAVRTAVLNLDAVVAPAGTMPVVLGSGWPGVLLHEAVGHGLEGDFNRKQSSAFSGRVGEKVASELCTIVDDGTLTGRRGSLNVDDEGHPTQYNVLIENGILKGYMQDSLNARLMGVTPTGNARRESYAHCPMPRMTNTYMLAGQHDPQEMIKSVKKGLYAVNFGGGQVDITSGKFVFSTSEAYLIEDGKVTTPVKGATLIGNGPEVMNKVSMVGHDLALDTGVGVCGKEGQSVPVGVGQPSLKIDEMTVGGTHSG